MKVICYECEKEIGEKAPFSDNRSTHGLCRECLKKVLEKRSSAGQPKEEMEFWRFDPEITSTSELSLPEESGDNSGI